MGQIKSGGRSACRRIVGVCDDSAFDAKPAVVFVHRPGKGVSLAFCSSSISFAAQPASPCKGPAELKNAIAAHPTAAAYDALGAYFGRRNQMACALPAFKKAVELAPGSSEGHYDLGIARACDRVLVTTHPVTPGTATLFQ
jgi:hypothetical protein